MGKWKKTWHGEVLKSKDDESVSYIKVKEPMVAGKTYNLESKEQQLASLDDAVSAGRLDAEYAETRKEAINNIPDFVRFQITSLAKNEE